MWSFSWPIILIVLSIPLTIVILSIIIAGTAFRKTKKEFSKKVLLCLRWWVYNNNGWWTIFFIATIILHLVAIQKTLTQMPVSKWDHEMAMSDPNSRTNKLYNFVRESVRGQKNYVPIIGNPPKCPRPTYHMWGFRALIMSVFTFFFSFYAASDEVFGAIKNAWKAHQERKQENQQKPQKEKQSGVSLLGIFFSDMLAELLGAKFGHQRHAF